MPGTYKTSRAKPRKRERLVFFKRTGCARVAASLSTRPLLSPISLSLSPSHSVTASHAPSPLPSASPLISLPGNRGGGDDGVGSSCGPQPPPPPSPHPPQGSPANPMVAVAFVALAGGSSGGRGIGFSGGPLPPPPPPPHPSFSRGGGGGIGAPVGRSGRGGGCGVSGVWI